MSRRPVRRPVAHRRPRPPGDAGAPGGAGAPARARARGATVAAAVLVAGLLVLPGPGAATTVAAPGRAVGAAPPPAPPVPRGALEAVARATGLDAGVTDADADADAEGAYRLPVTWGVLRERFDPPAQRWSAGHRGVDLEAAPGTAVVAPAAGTVVVAGPVVDRQVLTVLHDDGRRSSLEPVVGGVAVGTRVEAGALVGTVEPPPAATHCLPRCLHWGVREGERYVDPLGLLRGAGPVVLLPGAGADAA